MLHFPATALPSKEDTMLHFAAVALGGTRTSLTPAARRALAVVLLCFSVLSVQTITAPRADAHAAQSRSYGADALLSRSQTQLLKANYLSGMAPTASAANRASAARASSWWPCWWPPCDGNKPPPPPPPSPQPTPSPPPPR